MPEFRKHILENAMTVQQLRGALEDFDPNAPVLFICDYGDYHHTQQALPVENAEDAQSGDICNSAYSLSGIAYVDPDDVTLYDEPEEEEEEFPVVIIRS